MKNNERFGTCAYVRYRGGVLGEKPFDDHAEEPVKIILGSGQVVPGIEDALSVMDEGEEITIQVAPEDAYGRRDPEGIQVYPRTFFPFGHELEEGDSLSWVNPASGMRIPVKVIEATSDAVKVDFNHPLADKTLEYWLKIDRFVE